MSGTGESPSELQSADPEALVKALEAELILKRSAWRRAAARRDRWRALSFLLLFLVILGAFLAYFYFLPQLTRRGAGTPGAEAAQSTR